MNRSFAASQRRARFSFARPASLAAAVLGVAASLVSTGASADGHSASASMFANLARLGIDIGHKSANVVPSPTLVRGMYVLDTRQGEFVGFINESGTLFGDFRGFQVVPPNGPARVIDPNELVELRTEVMKNIEYDKLIRISSGDGGGRRLLLLSAVDCPSCKPFEAILNKSLRSTPSTIYVSPSSIQAIENSPREWDMVARLWCAPDNGRAWQTYWQTRAVPAARPCAITANSAMTSTRHLLSILKGAGIKIPGTPTLIREDGMVIPTAMRFDEGYAATLGSMGGINTVSRPPKWLVAGTQPALYQSNAQAIQGQVQQQGYGQPTKINTGDLLKKLFK